MVRNIAMSVYVCICLSVTISPKPHGRTLPDLMCMLTVAVSRSFHGGVAIRHVMGLLSVMWMTLCIFTVGLMARYCVTFKRREDNVTDGTATFLTKLYSAIKTIKYMWLMFCTWVEVCFLRLPCCYHCCCCCCCPQVQSCRRPVN